MDIHKIFKILLALAPISIFAAGSGHGGAPHLDGSAENLAIYWVIPFAGILLSIAAFPLISGNEYKSTLTKGISSLNFLAK